MRNSLVRNSPLREIDRTRAVQAARMTQTDRHSHRSLAVREPTICASRDRRRDGRIAFRRRDRQVKHVRCRLLVLAVAMTFLASAALIPGYAAAAELDVGEFFTDAEDIVGRPFAGAAYWLGHAGVFVGDAENRLLPDESFTRAQMATVLSRMTGEEDAAEEMEDVTTGWVDDEEIADWARGYMALAEEREWFLGDPDGSVRPEGALTFAEISALLARITDNGHLAEGDWPDAAMEAADVLGLFAAVQEVEADAEIARGDMVSATWAALRADRYIDHPEEEVADSLLQVNFEDTYQAWWDTLEEVPGSFSLSVTEDEGVLFFTVYDIEDEFGEPVEFDELEDYAFDAGASEMTFRGNDESVTYTFEYLGLVVGSEGSVDLAHPEWPFEMDEGIMKVADVDLTCEDIRIDVSLVGEEWSVDATFPFPEQVREDLADHYTSTADSGSVVFEDFLNVNMTQVLQDQMDPAAFSVTAEGKDFVIDSIDLLPPPGQDEYEHMLSWLEFWLDEEGDLVQAFDEVTITYTAADAQEGKELVTLLFNLPVEDFSVTFTAPPSPPDAALITATVDNNELEVVGEAGAVDAGAEVRVYEAPDGPGPPGELFGSVTAEDDGSFTFVDEDDHHQSGNLYLVTQVIDEVESRGSDSIEAE